MTVEPIHLPGHIQGALNYILPLPDSGSAGEALFTHAVQPLPPKRWTNMVIDPRNTNIYDARGREDDFSLDVSGFEFSEHSSTESEFLDEAIIKTRYYAEMEKLLKERTGSQYAVAIGHTIRRGYDASKADHVHCARPAHMVHADRTYEAAAAQAQKSLRDDGCLLKGRVRIINVWRPIGSAVHHEPLALADWRTVSVEDDLIPVRVIFPDHYIHLFAARHNKNHRWYYLKEQIPSEITFIKGFDSRADGLARLSLHSAFRDTGSSPDAPRRESIEVSVLLFDEE